MRAHNYQRGKCDCSRSLVSIYDGDRVIILHNDPERNCCCGDVGTLHIDDSLDLLHYSVWVELPDGRCPMWKNTPYVTLGLAKMRLAYALAINQSMKREYDTVLIPILPSMHTMFTRRLFYAAITRAKKRVVLFGRKEALDTMLRR